MHNFKIQFKNESGAASCQDKITGTGFTVPLEATGKKKNKWKKKR